MLFTFHYVLNSACFFYVQVEEFGLYVCWQMANAGLDLSLDCLDCVRNTPFFQQMVHPNSPSVPGNNKWVYCLPQHSSPLLFLRLAFTKCFYFLIVINQQLNNFFYCARSSSGAPYPEYLNLAHSIVEMEVRSLHRSTACLWRWKRFVLMCTFCLCQLCMKQEDWRWMGEVFRAICTSSQHPSQVEHISGRIAVALLSESKDKLSLPFSVFAETGKTVN